MSTEYNLSEQAKFYQEISVCKMHLSAECCNPDDQKYVVAVDAFKHIVLIVNLPCINLVEERHAHERVEDNCIVLRGPRLEYLRVMSTLNIQPPLLRT